MSHVTKLFLSLSLFAGSFALKAETILQVAGANVSTSGCSYFHSNRGTFALEYTNQDIGWGVTVLADVYADKNFSKKITTVVLPAVSDWTWGQTFSITTASRGSFAYGSLQFRVYSVSDTKEVTSYEPIYSISMPNTLCEAPAYLEALEVTEGLDL